MPTCFTTRRRTFRLRPIFTPLFLGAKRNRKQDGRIVPAGRPDLGAGFTLIELLLVMAITVFVAVLVISNISGLRRSAALEQAVNETLGLLREARSKTLSSEGASGYGVRFEADRVILFRGSTYAAGSPDNVILTLPAGVAISAVNLTTTTASIAFERLTGASAATGTVTFLGAGNAEKRIEILPSGLFIKQ